MSFVAAVLIFGIIIMIHEFGHFLFAKLNGIGVIEFSLGMGPRLYSFEKGGTRYSIKILPFGGSCMMLGEDEENSDQSAFNNKSVWARISVVAAGPIFNFLLAFLLSMVIVGLTGYQPATVMEVMDGYPAKEAGLLPGDLITEINGRNIHSKDDITLYIQTHAGKTITVEYKRADGNGGVERRSAVIVPQYSEEDGGYLMGVRFDGVAKPVSGLGQLLVHSAYEVKYWIQYVFDAFYMMFHGEVSLNDLSGPVGIVTTIDDTVDQVIPYGRTVVILTLINFCILLSANLGVMNLLPIPALDGGRLVFLFIEAVRGKPIDKEKEGMVHMAGMMLLMALMVLVLFNDVRKLF
ncbi:MULTISPECIES: RIP metalloprotease RseP [Enterocloster]|uniref:RIP metalloprotease RseP n=1 Tax=Enterocloster TaxID=2719313 RepID=UPI000D1A2775|nr:MULTISPECIES: RIP metalloprotease RseP [Enterocloster]MBS5604379.1 RIP metalloprotease RseP [Enterocloster asparagiformis]MDR3755433.1 RIP metalloprotease RseP [Enterocloster sp.]PST33981.1 RIP metalloprotease RseP [Enterocloster lavalensis]